MEGQVVNIANAILGLYPDLDPTVDFTARDEGDGPYLAEWNNSYPEPTEEDLARGKVNYTLHAKVLELLTLALRDFRAKYPEVRGDYSNLTLQDLWEFVMSLSIFILEAPSNPQRTQEAADVLAKLRSKRQEAETIAESTGTVEEIDAVDWSA